MSVTEVKLLGAGAGGGVDGRDFSTSTRSYSHKYQVKCDSALDGPNTVLDYFMLNTNLPWPGRVYRFGGTSYTGAGCSRVHVDYVENGGGIFSVSVDFKEFSTEEEQKERQPQDNGTLDENPFTWAPEIEVSSSSYSTPVEFAYFVGALNATALSPFLKTGSFLPITNSAQEPLDPTIEDEFSYKVIRFTTNVKSYDDSFYNTYNDSINKEYFEINLPKVGFFTACAKHYGKLKVTASLNFANGFRYWRRTLELHIRGWDRAILDQGTREFYMAGDTKPDGTIISANDLPRRRISMEIPITDDDGLPIDKPRLLDGNGKRLREGAVPVLLGWQTCLEADFKKIQWV